jgi:CRP-like cAMP-binding protein
LLDISAGGFLGQHTDTATDTSEENQMTGAEALCETSVLFLLPGQTHHWFNQDNEIGRLFTSWLHEDLVAQLRETQVRFGLEHDSALVCVVHALLVLDHLSLLNRMTRQQIAMMANLSVETTVRVISKLVREKYLASSRFTSLTDTERLALADLLEPYEVSNSPYS